ncbi:MAG TPA: glycosyltransferase, partial [Jiangellales bacterium]|nr:glycosyltransferase [Jiangellales bacterium]
MFPVAVALVLTSLLYLGLVLAKSRRPVPVPAQGAGDLLFVIVVPCLDEEIVIGDTLAALDALPEDRVRIIVVDDDSADATSSIAQRFAPRVELLQRRRPRAQLGKGDALNQAYQHVLATADRPLDRIVFGVVDADGRIDRRALDVGDRYFSESDVGGLQFAISIRNRASNLLARMQDFEFLGFAPVLLTAREHFGSVPLGGCGQFVRLSELTRTGSAPWTDSLTEDLDLGVRLLLEGSRVRFTALATVEQQGLTEIRPLVRQRTRWVQGHFQAWSLIPAVWRSRVPNRTFGDLVYMLLSPGF